MSDIGILGGSFDPFHNGHLSIAKAAMRECGLSQIILLPAKVQPFKLGRHMAAEEDRVNMVSLIAHQNQNFVVSTVEAFSEEISYTYKTLQTLKCQYPKDRLHFILGTDSFLSLETWYKGADLLREFPFVVGVRPGYKESETIEMVEKVRRCYDAKIKILHNKILEVSSTEIKENIKAGKSIRSLVPFPIERYIHEHRLYQDVY
ncbi:nicotinate-nucleotide adenylyltransferase [Anaerovoracaceae bacterium 41-7]|uniref:nicotinate-nucleotide adenylyltransferase n=1 Tax=Emergencia sp. 1XD21-10 TaxID=2304569 RepID=UPI00137A5A19|nr:nicotinate-nucleotide adenylyltransferase [Emergencia sp. 1XD21-10]NCE98993.1 nicotinate (nicotinamide) nucleotide adenylyltransferase [Emergencia sp. 1XD21-10]